MPAPAAKRLKKVFNGTESGTEISQHGPQKTAKPIEMTGIKW